jgi:hypothetical protein
MSSASKPNRIEVKCEHSLCKAWFGMDYSDHTWTKLDHEVADEFLASMLETHHEEMHADSEKPMKGVMTRAKQYYYDENFRFTRKEIPATVKKIVG